MTEFKSFYKTVVVTRVVSAIIPLGSTPMARAALTIVAIAMRSLCLILGACGMHTLDDSYGKSIYHL